MHKHLPCTLSRLSSSEPGAIVPVSGRLPGLHPIQLYWFRARMTDVPFPPSAAPPYIAPDPHGLWTTQNVCCLHRAGLLLRINSVGIGAIADIPRASQTGRSDAMAEWARGVHDTPTSPISTSGSWCCRAAGRLAYC